jgi:hypothetical protein
MVLPRAVRLVFQGWRAASTSGSWKKVKEDLLEEYPKVYIHSSITGQSINNKDDFSAMANFTEDKARSHKK